MVDSICPIEPTAPVPALSQTPASSMNVAVNNFIPDSTGWRKPNTDQGWSSWNHSSWEVRAREHMECDQWKHSDDWRAWSWGGHAGHIEQQKDKWSNGRGKANNWNADSEEWKSPQVADASPLPVEEAPVEAAPVASFVIPCRSYFLGKCKLGSTCTFQHTQMTSVSDEFLNYFIKNHMPYAIKQDIDLYAALSIPHHQDERHHHHHHSSPPSAQHHQYHHHHPQGPSAKLSVCTTHMHW